MRAKPAEIDNLKAKPRLDALCRDCPECGASGTRDGESIGCPCWNMDRSRPSAVFAERIHAGRSK